MPSLMDIKIICIDFFPLSLKTLCTLTKSCPIIIISSGNGAPKKIKGGLSATSQGNCIKLTPCSLWWCVFFQSLQ